MSGSVNKAILVGNLTAAPEIRRMQDGRPVANFSVATNERWTDKNSGEKRDRAEFHRVAIFSEGLCKVAENYLKKGSKVYLEGKIQTRKWLDQSGQDRYSTEIVLQGFDAKLVMLDSAKGSGYQPGGDGPQDYGMDPDRAAGPSAYEQASGGSVASSYSQGPGRPEGPDDEIGF